MGENKKKRAPILLILLCVAIGIAVAVIAWHFGNDNTVLTPDYALEEEENAETIPNDDGEKMEKPEGGGSVSLTYAKEVDIYLGTQVADLLFANPGKSNMDMVLQIIIQDTVIAQSGTLKPGKQVLTLDLLEGAAKKLSQGVYEGKFNVLFYDPVTGERSIVNTEIPITITVKN